MKGSLRHSFVYKTASILWGPILRRKFNYSYDNIKPQNTPYIVIANHVTNYDPMLVGLSFKENMYFVASDHLFRLGFISKLLNFLVSPIPRVKATTETQTVMNIFRRLRDGHNICVFAEGNSTFDGQTGSIPKSIAKLAKRSKVTLITYRLHGGYFSFPRWSTNIRKGRMYGKLVNEYTPQDLLSLTDDEVYSQICEDLYLDANTDPFLPGVSFKGKTLAENLEVALYCCPNCKNFATLKSKDDTLFCDCGLKLKYTQLGFFENSTDTDIPLKFRTILAWSKWQHDLLKDYIKTKLLHDEDTPLFEDENQLLFKTIRSRSNNLMAYGKLAFYKDRVEISDNKIPEKSFIFKYSDIQDMSIITQMNLVFSCKDGNTFEIHSKRPRSALKYLHLFKIITNSKT